MSLHFFLHLFSETDIFLKVRGIIVKKQSVKEQYLQPGKWFQMTKSVCMNCLYLVHIEVPACVNRTLLYENKTFIPQTNTWVEQKTIHPRALILPLVPIKVEAVPVHAMKDMGDWKYSSFYCTNWWKWPASLHGQSTSKKRNSAT